MTFQELFQEIWKELFISREIIIHTNIASIILHVLCFGYLFYITTKYLTRNNRKQHGHQYNKNNYGPYNKPDPEPKWYPTGWYWDEIECCWKPPDYPEK